MTVTMLLKVSCCARMSRMTLKMYGRTKFVRAIQKSARRRAVYDTTEDTVKMSEGQSRKCARRTAAFPSTHDLAVGRVGLQRTALVKTEEKQR